MIVNPKLSPKAGYVEVEKTDGTRTYMNVSTGMLVDAEKPIQPIESQIDDLQSAVIELTYNQVLYENGDTE